MILSELIASASSFAIKEEDGQRPRKRHKSRFGLVIGGSSDKWKFMAACKGDEETI